MKQKSSSIVVVDVAVCDCEEGHELHGKEMDWEGLCLFTG